MTDSRPQIVHLARLLSNESLSASTNILTLDAPELAKISLPGQFVQLKTKSQFLRRPIGVMSADLKQGRVQLGIRRVGKGSGELCDLPAGSILDVVGPLGHGFDLPSTGFALPSAGYGLPAGGVFSLITVGGGTGLFPLIYLLEEAKRQGLHTTAVAGFKDPAEAILLERMRDIADLSVFSSESGGLDFTGHAGDAFATVIKDELGLAKSKDADKGILVCACGPLAMLENIAAQCQEYEIPCQVSLEARMACGLGVCVGCSIPVFESADCVADKKETTYERCCYDGPVFPAERVIWPAQGGIW